MAAQKGFGSPRALDMADYVKRLVGEIADRMAEAGGEADIIELAYRVPLLVVIRMLGAPGEDMDLLRCWSDAIAGVKQFVGADIPQVTERAAHVGIVLLNAYIGHMPYHLRRHPDRNIRTHTWRERKGPAKT